MPGLPLEERVTLLEMEMLSLKRQLRTSAMPTQPWWEQITGTFADTPAFDEAIRLGRQYREAQPESGIEAHGDDVSS